jgi:hypothetical protein
VNRLRRWGPLVGVVVLIVATILRVFGEITAAEAFETIARFLNTDSALAAQIVAAITALAGVVVKIRNLIREARERDNTVSPDSLR